MADLTALAETTTAHGRRATPVLAALAGWWKRSPEAQDAEAMLGYESAHPWALDDDAATPPVAESAR